MPTQNVNLTPELDNFVREQISTGYFNNASEVHRAALAAMARKETERQLRLERLKVEIQKGLDDFEAGRVIEMRSPEELEKFTADCFREAMESLERADVEDVA